MKKFLIGMIILAGLASAMTCQKNVCQIVVEESILPTVDTISYNFTDRNDLSLPPDEPWWSLDTTNLDSCQRRHITIHVIASISKTFVGIAIMKLVESGKLKLDDPINDYLPFEIRSPHYPEVDITIRHLVTHTSSLNDEFDNGEKRLSQPSALTKEKKNHTQKKP